MSSYDDGKYGVIQRKWFGLTKKCGGDSAGGFTFGTTDATTQDHVVRYYPKGPIKLKKFGCLVLATLSNASVDKVTCRLYCDTGVEASLNAKHESTDTSQYTINSTSTFTSATIGPGSFLAIDSATPDTDDGTAANTASTTGSVAFFIDFCPIYHDSKWEA
jgi:hypothetical protein